MSGRIGISRLIVLLAATLFAASGVHAQTTWYVDDDAPHDPGPGDPTVSDPNENGTPEHPFDAIQEGIDAASPTDIVLVLDGTYTGPGNKGLDFGGRLITVRSENGPENCIIDCEGERRAFVFRNSETPDSIVDGFTITNGRRRFGGGVACLGGSNPTIRNCTITGNTAAYRGGGVSCEGQSSPTISNCTITGNSAGSDGGGISCYDYSSPTITECTISGNSAGRGGGISCDSNSSPTITNCTISGNTGTYISGGGIRCAFDSSPIISNCVITGNVVHGVGGGVSCAYQSDATIINCAITDNLAKEDGGGVGSALGGGVYCVDCNPTITGSTIARNRANYGAGVYCGQGFLGSGTDLLIANCTIARNHANADGGGVLCGDRGNATINNCAITANTAGDDGGGIACCSDSSRIANCTLAENTASCGGAISCSGSSNTATIVNCTLTANTADEYGGAIYCAYDAHPTVTNCILWGDSAPQGSEIALVVRSNRPAALTVSYSDVEGGEAAAHDEEGCTLAWGDGNIDADPQFAFTDDYHLMLDSPCVDAGTNDPPGGLPSDDLDGNPRPLDGDGDLIATGDMGAYEFNPDAPSIALSPALLDVYVPEAEPNSVDRLFFIRNCGGGALNWEIGEQCAWLDANPASGVSGGEISEVTLTIDTRGLAHGYYGCELTVSDPNAVNSPRTALVVLRVFGTLHVPSQYATIQAAIDAAVDRDVVLVADGVYTGPGNKNLDFAGKAIMLRSENGPESCTIDCEGDGRGLHFHSFESEASVVQGFTIRNGYVDSASAGGGYGGGILCEEGSRPTIAKCVIAQNQADLRGGGICCNESSPIITGCLIAKNSASAGGGVHCSRSDSTITDCLITENSATSGAGVYCYSSSPTIINCTLAENEAYHSGGAVECNRSDPLIANCTITGNTASYDGGGGIACWFRSPTIVNCTISENTAGLGGGVYCVSSSAAITDSTITGNSAYDGGGVCCHDESNATITNCTISGNSASYRGGGVYCVSSSATITDSTITGNSAHDGGGLRGNMTLSNCVIAENVAGESGGGVSGAVLVANCLIVGNTAQSVGGGLASSWTTIIVNSVIAGNNAAGWGGGVYAFGHPTITNCTITHNRANYGAGLYCVWGNATMTNSTISGNTGTYDGGGVYCSYYSSPTVTNCILWADSPNEIYSLGEPVVSYCDVEGGWPGEGNIDVDPLFVDPDGPDNDPNTWEDNDYHLLPDSPCIDAADNTAVPPDTADLDGDGDMNEPTPFDLDRRLRFADRIDTPDTGNPDPNFPELEIVDMGAYEYQCTGDLDGDGEVGLSDLAALLPNYGTTSGAVYPDGDLDRDGDVDLADLAELLSVYGTTCP